MSDSAAKEVTRMAAEARRSARNGGAEAGGGRTQADWHTPAEETDANTGKIDALLNTY